MNLDALNKIINIINIHNISKDITFDYFRVVRYNDDIGLKNKNNILFFPITITDNEIHKDGWYNIAVDLRNKIKDIVKNNPDFYYVIEPDMINEMPSDSRYIVVDNIMDSIFKLSKNALDNFNGKIITITGSVGKTTTAGFIQQVLKDRCLRIYSKRITPLVLECFVINYLNNDYDYLVVEASLWKKEHITYFSKTLKPDLAILLNIYEEHIGVWDIKNISDITKFKALLLEHAKNAIINYTDDELKKLNIKDGYVYYNNEKIVKTCVNELIKITKMHDEIKPYIKTKLTILEQTVAYITGTFYKIDEKKILNILDNVKTVEKRITKETLKGHNIIFDGDVSGVARLTNFFDHYYDKAYLIIVGLTENGEEEEAYEKLINTFNNFDKVYINTKYKKYFGDKAIYFNNLDFVEKLEPEASIFVHYGSYYRKFKEYNESSLEE